MGRLALGRAGQAVAALGLIWSIVAYGLYEVLYVMVMIGRIPGTSYFGQKYSRLNGFGSGAWGC
jgi:hypothetical protein